MSVSTIEQIKSTPSTPAADSPPLNFGDHLTRQEFEQRYHAHPEIKKAELIEGVVHMPSPIRFKQHSLPNSNIITWLGTYRANTPGVTGGDNATIRLDFENEVQPDALLRLDSKLGGSSQITDDDYLEGPPELIVEIAASSAAYDMHTKRRVYARNGVKEYLVAQMYEQKLDWFVLQEGVYQPLSPDETGIIHSQTFPGLWLNVEAFWADDLAAMLETLQTGLNSPEYAEFAKQLQPQD